MIESFDELQPKSSFLQRGLTAIGHELALD